MNPILQFLLNPLVFAGGFPISIIVTLTRQLCVEGGFFGVDSEKIGRIGVFGYDSNGNLCCQIKTVNLHNTENSEY